MEFDRHRDDVSGMPEQVVEDEVLASFDVHLDEYRAFSGKATEDIVNGGAVIMIVAPNSLFEMRSTRAEEELVVKPRKDPPQRSCPEQQKEAQQLTDRILDRRPKGDGVIVTMNNSFCIIFSEIAFKSPVVSKTERDQGVSCLYGVEWDDISAIIWGSNARERLTADRVKVGKPDRIVAF